MFLLQVFEFQEAFDTFKVAAGHETVNTSERDLFPIIVSNFQREC